MTTFEGKMWNKVGAIGWVESGYDLHPMMKVMQTEDDSKLRELANFVSAQCDNLVARVRDFELMTNVSFNLTDQQLAHVATEVVSRGKLTYDTYMAYPARLTGLHTNYRYTLPRLARVHN